MATAQEVKAITLRLSPDLYTAIAQAARQHSQSLNTYIQRNLEAIVHAEEEKQRFDAYTLLGSDTEEASVEYAIHAQAEVMLYQKECRHDCHAK